MQNRRLRKVFLKDSIPPWERKDRTPVWWGAVRTKVLKRDDFICQMCKKRDCVLEVHHINSIAEGGNHQLKNLISLCEECHRELTKLDFKKGVYGEDEEDVLWDGFLKKPYIIKKNGKKKYIEGLI